MPRSPGTPRVCCPFTGAGSAGLLPRVCAILHKLSCYFFNVLQLKNNLETGTWVLHCLSLLFSDCFSSTEQPPEKLNTGGGGGGGVGSPGPGSEATQDPAGGSAP